VLTEGPVSGTDLRVTSERRLRILAGLAIAGDSPEVQPLCAGCRSTLGVTGVGIMMMFDDTIAGSVCSSDATSARIEELQFTLGEGPCVDAYRLDRPVAEPDLVAPEASRWVAFAESAVEAGARAVFGFPVRTGTARLGALNLYNDHPGGLGDDQYLDALVVAEIAAQVILAVQAGLPPGELAAELEQTSDLRYVVHQAAGMVSVQLNVSVAHALIRLRAHAFGAERSLTDVAGEVVARRLRLAGDGDDPD
jgi:hypothetical protein